MQFADGSAVTLWTNLYPGATIAVSNSIQSVVHMHTRNVDAYLVWLANPRLADELAQPEPTSAASRP